MFEEDFERCFICEKACKGLYCSSECRLRDQGTASPAVNAHVGNVKITSQLPISLSPSVRPTHLPRSPRVVGRTRGSSSVSSDSSSVSSSPLESPQTNPSEADSPKKETFDLPPPAYPFKHLAGAPASVPLKIPALLPRAAVQPTGQTPGSHGSTIYPAGTSIDTLRFGRKPSAINSVTSPNALTPRCACGKPANHRRRSASKDRADLADAGFSRLSLGPSVIAPRHAHEEPGPRTTRIVSDPAVKAFHYSSATPGRSPIPLSIPQSPQVTGSASLLSRSRSDPIPDSPRAEKRPIPPVTVPVTNVITPSHRETFAPPVSPIVPAQASASRPSQRANALEVSPVSPRRGRSRERAEHHVGPIGPSPLVGPADREQAPSRSRHRRESRRRSNSRDRDRGDRSGSDRGRARPVEREGSGQRSPKSPLSGVVANGNGAQISPSWSRRASEAAMDRNRVVREAESAAMRRTSSNGQRLAGYPREEDEEQTDSKKTVLDRASKQLGQIFGVAAG
ncbi:hypothetical protein IAU60_000866 [Kwoniella sp. DSM 27419]